MSNAIAAKRTKEKSLTRAYVMRRIRGLDLDRQRSMVCALIGHTRIRDFCFGYHHCARCSVLLGDSLGGAYRDDAAVVYPSHLDGQSRPDCRCAENVKTLTWRDKLLVSDEVLESLGRP